MNRKCAYYPHGIGESVSERLFEKGLCLPSETAMTEEDIDRVVEVIKNETNAGIKTNKCWNDKDGDQGLKNTIYMGYY